MDKGRSVTQQRFGATEWDGKLEVAKQERLSDGRARTEHRKVRSNGKGREGRR